MPALPGGRLTLFSEPGTLEPAPFENRELLSFDAVVRMLAVAFGNSAMAAQFEKRKGYSRAFTQEATYLHCATRKILPFKNFCFRTQIMWFLRFRDLVGAGLYAPDERTTATS